MKSIFWILFLLIFFSGTANKSLLQKKDSFYLLYETPVGSIKITDTMMVRTTYIDDYDNPVSSTPASRRIQTSAVCLDRSRVQKFSNTLRSSGFKKLDAEYGISPEERYYPYRIRVKLGCHAYEVLYRSNPSGPTAPKAFTRVEKMINDFLKENHMD